MAVTWHQCVCKKQTELEAGLNPLHAADDDADMWLESTATAAVTK